MNLYKLVPTLKRVDINQSWLLRNRDDVLSWIRSAGACARLKHRGAGQYSGDTFILLNILADGL